MRVNSSEIDYWHIQQEAEDTAASFLYCFSSEFHQSNGASGTFSLLNFPGVLLEQ